MLKTGLRAIAWIAIVTVGFAAGCTGESTSERVDIDAIAFATTTIPPAGAGELYDVVITFTTVGRAAPPDRFELLAGELPEGVNLVPDREDRNGDGIPDPDGALTGNARLVGYPRTARPGLPYNFVIKAISTGVLSGESRDPNAAALAAEQPYEMTVGEGRIAILNPTAQQGTTDPAVPAFPDVINFVNPANPQAFFSFAFQTAGGSGNNNLQIYVPRELELSVFDKLAVGNNDDTNEAPGSGSKYRVDFSDGGVFNLQAGNTKVQIGGFQSPRGVVGTITNLDSDWFQSSPGAGGPPLNSRRSFGDDEGLAAGDPTLGTAQPILFSDYFSPSFLPTWGEDSDPAVRRKYPFISTEYHNAFFLAFDAALHQTPLRFNAIVEAIDNRGTVTRNDDVIARKSYAVQVRIPEIVFDTVLLPAGRAGVDYMEFVNGSGGVPPLSYDLEWVDGVNDAKITTASALDKAAFGININAATGGFYGVPKASGAVDLSVRIYAEVMNPQQGGAAQIPTGGTDTLGRPNEWNGTHSVTGKTGIHKTLSVNFAAPSAPTLTNKSLPPGIDGNAYRTSGGGTVKLTGGGGVPSLVPDPVTHLGPYPANPTRAYAWSSLYTKDKSHADEGAVVPGLPNALTLDGAPFSSTNGEITGTAFDRGFHPVVIQQIDFYIGPATNPSLDDNRQTQGTSLTLSVSPDNALYLRGLQTDEGSDGEESGLLHTTTQIKEPRMVPMFLESALFQTNTGEAPKVFEAMPPAVDLLPVAIPHGDSQLHTDRDQPVVSGFWPAEAGSEQDWYYYQNRAWKDTQQEMTWIQIPNKEQSRVFLWGETRITSYSNNNPDGSQSNTSYPGGYEQMYQQYLETGDRGVLIVNPGTGDYWMPARLDNASSAHGWTFGSEWTQSRISMSSYHGGYYGAYYYYSNSPYHVWGAHSYGLGAYLENHGTSTTSGNGWIQNSIGRTATSVAVSADGLWCATAMAGGDAQKLLLWRTDGNSIDANITGQSYVTGLDGADKDGNTIPNSAAIVNIPGSGSANADDLLPDSLMFVDGGLVFLRYTTTSTSAYSLDQVFGLNLRDGTITSKNLNSAVAVNSDQDPGTASLVVASRAIYIPDQDQGYGNIMQPGAAAQFAFTGNKPVPGRHGPNALAFVAGDNEYLVRNSNNSKFPRSGFQYLGERPKSVFFLQINPDAHTNGLNLGSANTVITDLTGDDSRVYGEFLSPGRRGEGADWLKMSDDGKYVAAVRDWHQDSTNSTSYGRDTFGNSYYYYYTSSGLFQYSSDDLLVMSTPIAHAAGEVDMDSDKNGDQHVLFIGTSTGNTSGTAGSTPAMPSYASARNLINGNTRKVSGLEFSKDGNALFFDYTGDSWTMSKHSGYAYGWGFNPGSIGTSTTYYNNIGLQLAIRFQFRDADDGSEIDLGGSATSLATNVMTGMSGVGQVGDTSAPFTVTRYASFSSGGTRDTDQVFHVKFRSANGDFQYYVSDRMDSASHMFGVNMTANDIESPEGKTRKPYEAFKAHGAGVSFEQMEYKGFLYGNRVAASPSGTTLETTGRDGSGIVFIIGSDAAASGSATNLEIYALNANLGGECVALTSAVTTGASNAINYLYPSMDGNSIVAQRSDATNSRDSRVQLTSQNDIIAVTNVHDVIYNGASPVAFTVSEKASHGSSVAFVGDGTPAGAVALVYSWSDATGNQSWAERTLYIGLLAPGAGRSVLDTTESHYAILSGGRKLDDDPNSSD